MCTVVSVCVCACVCVWAGVCVCVCVCVAWCECVCTRGGDAPVHAGAGGAKKMNSQEAINGRMQLRSAANAGEDAQKRSTKRKNTSNAAKWRKIQRSVRARGVRWLG